ncbi:hypothetical protein CFR75_08260 [Komagataeibacter xylinus]|uniref:Uncharacterized protein n=1 Tax=Komagataeibacter xylinus TaxID=28448 RepID=A0A318PJ82_KOMXY|nr:DUF6587 family protein [Komagataeibacter xylinus]AZV39262.1 hypothetical protein CXP35_11200 [Komagataeibacter xylinus]PYD56933.1 hypothetical protein CFR75_08260 [Komagataeibacter xylinus]GBQ73199.1 hypothetical protein AA15237_1541 [Komagataeibacter xylinus NBRC 15237]
MHAPQWLQALVAATLVAACAAYWLGRLFPRLGQAGWQATAGLLRRIHAPQALIRPAQARARPRPKGGCGGCSGCADKDCGPKT